MLAVAVFAFDDPFVDGYPSGVRSSMQYAGKLHGWSRNSRLRGWSVSISSITSSVDRFQDEPPDVAAQPGFGPVRTLRFARHEIVRRIRFCRENRRLSLGGQRRFPAKPHGVLAFLPHAIHQ